MVLKAILLIFFLANAASVKTQALNIGDFGANGDGKQVNTAIIQAVIDSAHRAGGGEIWIPSGTFLTGSLRLYSNLSIRLSPGAILKGSPNLRDYNALHPHLLYALDAVNIHISGNGIIDGNGEAFYRLGDEVWTEGHRPLPWIKFEGCRFLSFRGVRLINSPAHVLVLEGCSDVVIDGIRIENDFRSPNTDGIDINDSRDIFIANCFISTGDDAICLKSRQDTVKHIIVQNCIIESDDAAIKTGTSTYKGVQDCLFTDLQIRRTRYGIALFMFDGGLHKNLVFSNIQMDMQSRHKTEYPIFIDIHRRSADSRLGGQQNIVFRNIDIRTRGNILVAGQEGYPLRELVFENIRMEIGQEADLSQAGSRKPSGNKKFPLFPELVDLHREAAHFTLGYATDVRLHNIQIIKRGETRRSDFFVTNSSGIKVSDTPWDNSRVMNAEVILPR